MSKVDDKEYEELLDLFRKNNLTKYGIDKLYGAIIDRKIKSKLEIERLNKIIQEKDKEISFLKASIKVFTDKWNI